MNEDFQNYVYEDFQDQVYEDFQDEIYEDSDLFISKQCGKCP
jgi:hypothetical protein